MTGAWFRRRLDRDPRRWVLLLATLEGLGGLALRVEAWWPEGTRRPDAFSAGWVFAVWCGLAVLAPFFGLVVMIVHGRLIWWTGVLLGGRARPVELHAAGAWAALPFLVGAAPLLLVVPLRLAAVPLEPRPPALERALAAFDASTGALILAAAVASLLSALAYLVYLAEAQGFGWARALLNPWLAGLSGLAMIAAGVAVAALGFREASAPAVLTAIGVVAALAVGAELAARARWREAQR
ncbi:hypothetical protein [Anaeromyxobacter dehalogenans]|uniref:Yip1 domain-containing protein n=1 Tax=Anaeromyxobacter dehalogenans (strain 2CP-C) TaxID=290397 RepID=Q2IDN1_ANADE|nr:hypothetical protein [Anaeromyxobacter dehalogenans]ABC82688.1 hypothetical protein Adeh_2918 [Anaeromyxobacter dehalogenans 2CP-C]